MILLDTDHINALQTSEGAVYDRLLGNMMAASDQDFATTVITLEEQMRGWLAVINRTRHIHLQVLPYKRLASLIYFFSQWKTQPFDGRAAEQFEQLRSQKVRIGTMDLKIASIALTQDALLLSANLRDFKRVPNLRVQDWLH